MLYLNKNTKYEIENDAPEVLEKLEELDIPFYLVGSRRYGTHNKDSDYDFTCSYLSKKQRNLLRGIGFIDSNYIHSYKDIFTDRVLPHSSNPVEICVCKRQMLDIKINAVEYINKTPIISKTLQFLKNQEKNWKKEIANLQPTNSPHLSPEYGLDYKIGMSKNARLALCNSIFASFLYGE